MLRRNLHKLHVGTAVYIATGMIGRHSQRSSMNHGEILSGFVERVTENGGVLVALANWRDVAIEDALSKYAKWFPYHAIRVAGTRNGEPGDGQYVRRVAANRLVDRNAENPSDGWNPDAPLWPEER